MMSYRYGFNGMEKDDEVKGSGNHYDLGLRNYDPRIGRMFSIDPRATEYPWQTTYAYHRNSPINVIDYLGGGDGGDEDRKEGADRNVMELVAPDTPISKTEYWHKGSEYTYTDDDGNEVTGGYKAGWYSPSEYRNIVKYTLFDSETDFADSYYSVANDVYAEQLQKNDMWFNPFSGGFEVNPYGTKGIEQVYVMDDLILTFGTAGTYAALKAGVRGLYGVGKRYALRKFYGLKYGVTFSGHTMSIGTKISGHYRIVSSYHKPASGWTNIVMHGNQFRDMGLPRFNSILDAYSVSGNLNLFICRAAMNGDALALSIMRNSNVRASYYFVAPTSKAVRFYQFESYKKMIKGQELFIPKGVEGFTQF